MAIRVCLAGATGWAGSALVHGIAGCDDMELVTACLESGLCKSFATWGISDSTSWIMCTDAW